MFENLNLLIYLIVGAAITYLALEITWHYAACRIVDNRVQPYAFKQIRNAVITGSRYNT
jgi:hypothetical protein